MGCSSKRSTKRLMAVGMGFRPPVGRRLGRVPGCVLAGAVLVLFVLVGVAFAGPAEAAILSDVGTLNVSMAPLNPAFLRSLADPSAAGSSSEDVGQALGGRPGPQDFSYTAGMQVPGVRNLGIPPATYDLRTLGRVTPVKDQGSLGTCWAFAATGSLESGLLPGDTWDFSEDNMALTSGFNYPGGSYMAGGQIWMSTAYLVRWDGPVNESEDAYGDSYTPAGLTSRKHVQEVNWIPPRGSATDNDTIKNAVMLYGAADVSMGAYNMSSNSSYYNAATASYYLNVSLDTNHEVLIVGWDDNYAASNFATTPPGNGAFLVKNSWGTGWGNGGYFWASYYDSAFGRGPNPMAVYNTAQPTNNYGGIYQYDRLGEVGASGYGSTTGWFANVFTAQATASLGAVGFYSETPGTSYEVYTGTSLAAKTLRTSGTLAYMGYHTVTLPTPVGVTNGQPFVVFVKVTSPGTTWPIAIEYPEAGYSSAATAQLGQSYFSPDGASWDDTAAWRANTNVCLKAYVTSSALAPTITSLSPTTGPAAGGTTVTITGTDFTGATTLAFGGTTTTAYTIDSDTQITATSPAGTGTVDVRVTATGGTSANTVADDFTYLALPTISHLYPGAGPLGGGNQVVIAGTGFSGVSEVRIGSQVISEASYVVTSAVRITVANAPAGEAGTVQVQVTTSGGSTPDTALDDYTYTETPTEVGLTATASGTGAIACTPDKSSYYLGELVLVEAVPDPGWGFICWTGDVTGAANPREVVMDGEKSLVATFSDTALQVQTGWNLVASAPGTTFGDVLFSWTGSAYLSATDPVAWAGYWLRGSSSRLVYFVTAPGPQTLSLVAGWNLVGNPMGVAAALTLPVGRAAFIYDPVTRAYSSTLTLQPGQGAWVRGAEGESVTFTEAP